MPLMRRNENTTRRSLQLLEQSGGRSSKKKSAHNQHVSAPSTHRMGPVYRLVEETKQILSPRKHTKPHMYKCFCLHCRQFFLIFFFLFLVFFFGFFFFSPPLHVMKKKILCFLPENSSARRPACCSYDLSHMSWLRGNRVILFLRLSHSNNMINTVFSGWFKSVNPSKKFKERRPPWPLS